MKILIKVFQIFACILILGVLYLLFQYFIKWDSVKIDNNISKNPVYKKIDKQIVNEIFSLHKEEKYTNNVIFSLDENALKIEEFNYHNCNIYFQGPLLVISFTSGDGFSGGGYEIKVLKNRFNVKPYHYTDVIRPFDFLEIDEQYKLLESTLILNQNSYKRGDSIFGYTKFKIEKGTGSEKYFENGKGYFRGIIN